MSGPSPVASRFVVAFDTYAPHRAALELALRLASPGAQRLHALYVEETDPLAASSFPWVQEIMSATAESQPLRPEAIERIYRRRAADARALFDALVDAGSGATFELRRGRLADELRRMSTGAAGVLIDWPSSTRRGHRATMIVRTLLDARVPLIGLVDPRAAASAPVIVVGSPTRATIALRLAERVAAPGHARITRLGHRTSAVDVIDCALAELAGTVLLQLGRDEEDEQLVNTLALKWSGSLLVAH